MRKEQICEPEMLKEIGKLRGLDVTWKAIQQKIENKFNIETTPALVKSAYNRFVAKTSEIIASDESIKRELTKPILDTADQLSKINEITWKLINNVKADKDKLAALKEIRNQLEMQERILSKLTQTIDSDKISAIKYIEKSVGNLQELEKQGLITINRRKSRFSDMINVTQQDSGVDQEKED